MGLKPLTWIFGFLAYVPLAVAAPMTLEQRVSALEASVTALGRENETLKIRLKTLSGQVDYPPQDQHDSLSLTEQELITEINVDEIETVSHHILFQKAKEGVTGGYVPERTYLQLELEVALDPIHDRALHKRLESIRTKKRSLLALRDGKLIDFAVADRDANRLQLEWFQAEEEKAKKIAEYTAAYYTLIHRSYLEGASTWGKDHELEVQKKKTQEQLVGWSRKVEEQKKQLAVSELELQRLRAH